MFNLVPKAFLDPMFEYEEARFVKSKNRDYIVFRVWHVQKGKLVRKRSYVPASKKTAKARKAWVKNEIKVINTVLADGMHIDLSKDPKKFLAPEKKKSKKRIARKELHECLTKYVGFKQAKKNYSRGVDFSRNTASRFIEWCMEEKEDRELRAIKYLDEVTSEYAEEYLGYLITVKGNEPKTRNNALGVLKNFFKELKEHKWLPKKKKNPFGKIKKLPESEGTRHYPYTDKQISEIKKYVLKNDPYLWFIISFIYYGLFRVSELKRLKVDDIDLENNKLYVYGRTSKVKKYAVLPISPAFKKVIEQMNLEDYPKDYFLFTASRKPSPIKMGENYVTTHYKKVKKAVGIDNDNRYSVYGFKHTAVCNWYKKTKDIIRIQRMCRHKHVTTTEIYLKSLGLISEDDSSGGIPTI